MPHARLSKVRDDVLGGLVSAAVAIPLAMGYGMFALVSLGDEYFDNGAFAGLCAAFVVAVVSVVLGDKTPTVYAPRINSTFFLGAFLYGLVHSETITAQAHGTPLILVVFFSVVFLGGLFQALFGLSRVGTLLKYVPHPVMAGFQTTAAVLLFLVQLADVSGYAEAKPFTFVLTHPGEIKPLSVALATLTFAVMWNSGKIASKIPPLLVGLALGTGVYYLLIALGLGDHLGPVIGGATKDALDHAPSANIGELVQGDVVFKLWPTIFGGGLALATIASIDALLCARLVRRPGDVRLHADRLLVRLGIGNVASACSGGITSGINIGPTLVNRGFGGRTPLSVVVNAAAIFLALTILFPVVTQLPRAVLSAVIMVVAVQHFEPWSMQLIRRIAGSSGPQRHFLIVDLLVVLLVAVLSITVNIVLAVFLGTVIAVMLFVVRMSRSIVRRSYRCQAISSRRSRDAREMQALEHHGGSILVMELQGALFFGTGEGLVDEITTATRQETRALILDLRRISEVDSTGARILLDVQADLMRDGSSLGLVLSQRSDILLRLRDFGVLEGISADHIFEDVDRAIEWAEDGLVSEVVGAPLLAQEVPLDQVGILHNFDPGELAALEARLTRVSYAKGAVIFRQGDSGTDMFIVTKGTASAFIHQPTGRDIRLVTFAPGTVFGELATLDAGPRSASIVADEDFAAYALSQVQFAALSRETPATAIKLLANLGRELCARLRRADRMIDELEA
jgi:MFS superfamily sulfate permease-like transporter/CRP-like cAMP-binding protein